jgi:hypothetical protein
MNLKTTLLLAALLVVGGAAWVAFNRLRPGEPPAQALVVLGDDLKADRVHRIEVGRGDSRVVLEKNGDEWTLPGQWPVREPEARQIVTTLTGLRSRFAPIPLSGDADLATYGLDTARRPLTVKVTAGDKTHDLVFGEKPDENNRFSRETYVRVDGAKEVIRLAPGLIAALDRPQEYYMQRRLFPVERVTAPAREGETPEKVEQVAARVIDVKGAAGEYSLERAGDDWELRKPYRDRPDPEKLKTVLTNLPDVWAETFVDTKGKDLKEFGLDKPEDTLSVTRANGDVVTLLVGKQSQEKTRTIAPPPQPQFGQPPMPPRVIREQYRFAKLKDNDQVFEIKADKLKEVVVGADAVRDAQLARFRADDVRRLEITEGQQHLTFVKDKDKSTWKFEVPSAVEAESVRVTELLDKLAGLQARDKDVIGAAADPKAYGLEKPSTIKLTIEESKGTGENKTTKTRELTFDVGKEDAEKNKLYVQVAGWPRVNAVDPEVLKLIQRPAIAYRNRKVLDFSPLDVAKVEVKRGDESFALEQVNHVWRLATPVQADADPAKVAPLTGDLGRLEVTEFVEDTPKSDDLEKNYGLGKPALSVTVKFADDKKPAQTLLVGKQRPGKPEYFAKLASAPAVFSIKKETFEALDRDSLAYRPLELWRLPPEDIAEVRVSKGEPEYTLKREADGWKISGPFEAAADPARVGPMTAALAQMRGERYVGHTAKDLGTYGLDKPYLRVVIKPTEKKADPSPAENAEGKKDEKKERVLIIGKPTDKDAKSRFAKLGDSEAVFVVGEKAVAAIDQPALELLDRKLLGVDLRTIHTLRAAGASKYTLKQDKDEWRLTDSPAPPFIADRQAVGETLRSFADLRAQRFAAYGDKVNLAEYGLDKPTATLTAVVQPPGPLDRPVEHTLVLGKAVEGSKGEYYARLDKGPGVAVLDAHTVADLNRTPLEFVDRTVLKLDAAKVSGLTCKVGADEVELVKRDDGWKMVKPTDQTADGPTLERLIGQLADLRAVRVAAFPAADVKPFGLDSPAAVVTVRLTDASGKPVEHVLQIGKVDEEKGKENGDRFARVDKSEAVVVLPGALTKQLMSGALGFRDRNLARLGAADRITLERGPRKAVFAKSRGFWKMTEPVEADAEEADLEDWMKGLVRLRADELVADKPADLKPFGLDRPQARWRFASGDKDALVLLVGATKKEADGKTERAYARIEGNDVVFLLDPHLTARALGEYRSRKVWSPAPPDAAQAERISYGYADGPFVLEKPDGTWRIAGKPDVAVKAETVSDALDALAGLRAERYVADKGTDLKQYGLDPQAPYLKLEVQTPGGKRVLHVGRQEGESKRHYATMPTEGAPVFIISEADAGRILKTQQGFTGMKP